MRSAEHKAPCYVVFSTPLLPRPCYAQTSSSAPYYGKPSTYIPPSVWVTNFHTHTKQQARLQFCISWSLCFGYVLFYTTSIYIMFFPWRERPILTKIQYTQNNRNISTNKTSYLTSNRSIHLTQRHFSAYTTQLNTVLCQADVMTYAFNIYGRKYEYGWISTVTWEDNFGKSFAKDRLLRFCAVGGHSLRSVQLINGQPLFVSIARTGLSWAIHSWISELNIEMKNPATYCNEERRCI